MGLDGACTEVWGHGDLGKREQWRLGRRFLGEDIDRSTGDGTIGDGRCQIGLVDDATTGDVDDPQTGLGLGQHFGVYEVHRLGGAGQVQCHEVARADQGFEIDQFAAKFGSSSSVDERIEGHQVHIEGLGTGRNEATNAAEADDAQGLLGQLDPVPLAALPAAVNERCMRLSDIAGLGQHHRQCVLGGRHGVGERCVGYQHVVGRRRLDIDIVETDTSAADDLQV